MKPLPAVVPQSRGILQRAPDRIPPRLRARRHDRCAPVRRGPGEGTVPPGHRLGAGRSSGDLRGGGPPGPDRADLQVLVDGTRHPSEAVQRQALRAIGRLERASLVADIEPMLASPFPSVRAAAADALGQAVSADPNGRLNAVVAALLKRLAVEKDSAVVGAMCWTIGRLPYATAQAARSAEVTLLVASLPIDSRAGAPIDVKLGVARGFESLLRRNAKLFSPAPETVRRLRQLATDRRTAKRGDEAEQAARVRRLAMAALAAARQVDEAILTAAAADPDGQLRRLALVALAAAAPGAVPDAARATLMSARPHGSRSTGALRGPPHPRPVVDWCRRELGSGVRSRRGSDLRRWRCWPSTCCRDPNRSGRRQSSDCGAKRRRYRRRVRRRQAHHLLVAERWPCPNGTARPTRWCHWRGSRQTRPGCSCRASRPARSGPCACTRLAQPRCCATPSACGAWRVTSATTSATPPSPG